MLYFIVELTKNNKNLYIMKKKSHKPAALFVVCSLLFCFAVMPAKGTRECANSLSVKVYKDTIIPPEYPWPFSPDTFPVPDTLSVAMD